MREEFRHKASPVYIRATLFAERESQKGVPDSNALRRFGFPE